MRNKSLLAASLVLPLLVLGCDRAEQSPTAANPSAERQANTPSAEDRMLEKSAPAAGAPSTPDSSSPAMSPPKVLDDSAAPATSSSEPKKAY
ncbi:hypothetical protein [Dechloromonas sp. A34]|uniref:hypothetical protein n=1 Tax=Dechloromonas sp. A34 TaxID=447588 RepID=UPI00224904AD|nr:hypothetical protein [Dechloromonas sp. A34]